jgi:hemolysin activation/secretion protein
MKRSFQLAFVLGTAACIPALHAQTLPALQQNVQLAQLPGLPGLPPPQQFLRELSPDPRPRLSPGLRGAPVTPQPAEAGLGGVNVVEANVTGNEALPTSMLARHLAGLAGQAASAEQIEAARVAILTEYRNAGFPFLSVVASAQAVAGGNRLTFTVQEGRVARVRLDGNIGPAGTQVLRFLDGAVSEGAATAARIERALLLAGDVPGVTVRGVLRPLEGGAPGDLELVAEVSRRAFSGFITGDNRGFQRAGPVQFLLVGQANSFTSFGERTEASFYTSAQAEAVFGQASTEFFVGGSGLRVRLYAGAGYTQPSGVLSTIGYNAFTRIAGGALTYPIIRARSANLFAALQFDLYDNTVETGTTQVVRTSKDYVRVVRGGFDGQYLDSFLPLPGLAVNAGNIRFHQGVTTFGASQDGRSPPPSRQGSDFGFTKITGEYQRTQPIFTYRDMLFSLQGTVAGQWSNDILPVSEKFFLGGTRLGRGFYAGQVSGDSAYGFTAEAQLDFLNMRSFTIAPGGGSARELRPAAQLYMFYDTGRTYENLPSDPNRRIESWGGGIRTNVNNAVFLDIEGVSRVTRSVDAAGSAVRPLAATAGYMRLMTRF